MDRVLYIQRFANECAPIEAGAFIHAFVRCLSPEESVELLQRSLVGDTTIRRAALRKVCSSIENGSIIDPSGLLANLQQQVANSEPRHRSGYAYCLLEVSRVCDGRVRCNIQSNLGSSKYVGLRRRSYKLYDSKLPDSRALLEHAWHAFHDREAAWLIVKTFPLEFLVENKRDLVDSFTEGWQFSKLYLRLAEIEPTVVDELLKIDPVSYLYVMAKLGRSVTRRTLSSILDSSLGDERLGLVLWCMGELREWDQLVAASARASEIAKARFPICGSGIS